MSGNISLNNPNKDRYCALDVLRGLTVALMIVVNTLGSWSTNFAPFLHASWHGFTITDLVFPSFLFVVGYAMSFSLRKLQQQDNHQEFLKKLHAPDLVDWTLDGQEKNLHQSLTRNPVQ